MAAETPASTSTSTSAPTSTSTSKGRFPPPPFSRDDYVGHWKQTAVENAEEFFKAKGFGWMKRKVASKFALQVHLELSEDGSEYNIELVLPVKRFAVEGTMGVEAETPDPMSDEPTRTVTWWSDAGHIVTRVTNLATGAITSIDRFLEDGKFIMTFTENGVTCKRTLERQSGSK